MATITLRQVKGAPLTIAEVDANFSNLNLDKIERVLSVNDANPALRITQVGTGSALLVEDETNPDSTPFIVTAAGDIGIGTSAPVTKLDVIGVSRATSFTSTVATGTAPLVVSSTTKVANLNADLLDDMTATSANTANTVVARDGSGGFSAGPISVTTGTFSGLVNNTNGRYTTSNASVAMYEAHIPGSYAAAMYVESTNLRFAQTNGAGSVTNINFTIDTNGNVTARGNVTAFSDERLKENWSYVPSIVENLATVKSGSYTLKSSGQRQVGVSAQSLQKVLPEAVVENEEGTLSVAYGNAALVACVELAKRVLRLEQELQELRNANQA